MDRRFVVVALLPGDARAFSCGSDVCTKNVHVCCKSSEGSTHTCETPIDCAPEFWTKGLKGKTTFYCGIGDCSFGKVCCEVDNDSPNCKSTEECPLERWQKGPDGKPIANDPFANPSPTQSDASSDAVVSTRDCDPRNKCGAGALTKKCCANGVHSEDPAAWPTKSKCVVASYNGILSCEDHGEGMTIRWKEADAAPWVFPKYAWKSWKKIRAGLSAGRERKEYWTIGAILQSKSNPSTKFFLTNAHNFAPSNGRVVTRDEIVSQPSLNFADSLHQNDLFPSQIGPRAIGRFVWHVGGCNEDTDLMDAAVVAFDDEIETKCTVLTGGTTDQRLNELPVLGMATDVKADDVVMFHGRTDGLTKLKVQAVENDGDGNAVSYALDAFDPIADDDVKAHGNPNGPVNGGDSGSVAYKCNDVGCWAVCLYDGNPFGCYSVAAILKRLNDGEGTFHGDAIPRDLELCVHTLPPTVGAVSNLRTNTEKN